MRPIRQLPTSVTNKIAAGEVVERPASAVKEMLENAIDAGAGRITLELEEGGRDLIRIVDDGCGIPADELPLAVAPHATSKIISADELFSVRTLGFRGEALASIAGVGAVTIKSKPRDQEVGAQIKVHHGDVGTVEPCGCARGTQIEVRDLFASVPVRRKFLKSKATEIGHVSEAITRLALAYPGIALKLTHNGRQVVERPGQGDRRSTIRQLFGADVANNLIPLHSDIDGIIVDGFAVSPTIDKANNKGLYLYVNGRFIRDRSLLHAIAEGYRGLVLHGRYPMAFVFLTVPSDTVDVNVHPTKIEVRFQDGHRLFSQVLSTIRTTFLESDLIGQIKTDRAASKKSHEDSSQEPGPSEQWKFKASASPQTASQLPLTADEDDGAGRGPNPWDHPAQSMTPDRRAQLNAALDAARAANDAVLPPKSPANGSAAPAGPSALSQSLAPSASRPPHVQPHGSPDAPPASEITPATSNTTLPTTPLENQDVDNNSPPPRSAPSGVENPPASSENDPLDGRPALQVHNAYLVVESDDGLTIIDQHALHERILFEQLRRRCHANAVESQALLVPEPVDLSPLQVGLLMEHTDVLAQLGLGIEEFGERCVLVRQIPTLTRRLTPADLVRQVAAHLEDSGQVPSRDQLLEDVLAMMACKAAVKFGDPLTPEEITELVKLRHLADDAHHCPHGRPSMLRLSLKQLEKEFRRV